MSGITPFRNVSQSNVDYYWYPRIPLGCLTILFGRAGIGKSTAMYDVLARASRADRFPLAADLPPSPRDVLNARSIVVGMEDTPERVASVLEAAGADLDNVGLIAQDQLPDPSKSPLSQLDYVREQVVAFRARMLYVDNMSAALTGETDTKNEQSVRYALHPLDAMAKDLGIAVVLTSHPRKGQGGDVLESLSGSAGFINLVRSVLFAARINHNEVGLALAKSNYYPKERCHTLSYQLKSEVVGQMDGQDVLGVPSVDWLGVSPFDAQGLHDLAVKHSRAKIAKVMEEAIQAAQPPPVPVPVEPTGEQEMDEAIERIRQQTKELAARVKADA